ncbi:hypothetical protein P3X46_023184 [Hevea brasiliensis]|uniref:Uncharacterized protein n=1 Tax=Hevea brasiliensis TaxID=3981 RepID=A0ABQ9LA95_HEVBR|nr:uncharacterized protein LOC110666512 [Hevea brasiliensis]KAJ9163526.1 hypothetical protein P3X46_023184 [Hevea brasiliensis]
MDLWVFGAAAAAAGYIAKHWQCVSRDRDSLAESGKNESPSYPFRRLTWRRKLAEDTSTSERLSDMYRLDGALEAEVSTSGYDEKLGSLEEYEHNIFSLSSLPLGFSRDENLKECEGENGLSGDNCGSPCTGEMDSFHDSTRKRNSLRTKHLYRHIIKPLSSLESCLMAQLYKEHINMEEYVLSVFPSSSTTTRPLLVTNGNQTIDRVNGHSFSAQISTDDNRLHKEENLCRPCGVPPLPKISALDVPNKIKSKIGKGHGERYSDSHKAGSGRHFNSQNGSLDRTILFCLGICVGIVSSLLANGRELDKLKNLLKQKENLVQDLQEELEMKDSLTVKELADENCESQYTCENSFDFRAPNPVVSVHNMENATNNDGKESHHYEKAEETLEDMSEIEAELEAELERLGLNMNTSNLERRLSDLVELDPNFVADIAQGELRADMVNGQAVNQLESDRDASGTSTSHTGNYTVSPRELSLRLHEVIQSRLEERVKKLEMALKSSERKLQLWESEHRNVWRKFPNSELRYSSGEEIEEDFNSMTTQPLVMNLSGEALDAYNEAYEELMKINESQEDDLLSGVYENNHQGGIHPFDESNLRGQNGATNSSLIHLTRNREKPSRELHFNQLKASVERGSENQELLYDAASEDENSDCSDEIEKQLIKHVVEKTRKGSPVVLNAQRLLFSMDENEV